MTSRAAPREVVILHGADPASARPDEADTLAQAEFVGGLLEGLGHRVRTLALGLDLSPLTSLAGAPKLSVFNLVESLAGQGALLHLPAAVLESLRVPFTGAGSLALALTTDKPVAKRLLRGAGLPTPDWWVDDAPPPGAAVIVKPANEDASLGLDAGSVLPGAQAPRALKDRRAGGGAWFAEAFVDGREFNVSLLSGETGVDVLPVAEIRFEGFPAGRPRIVDYEAKWAPDSAACRGTVRHTLAAGEEPALARRLARLALETWQLFGLRGHARVDFRVDAAGTPWIIDVNANPCLSPDAGFMAAAEAAGIGATDAIGRILASADAGP